MSKEMNRAMTPHERKLAEKRAQRDSTRLDVLSLADGKEIRLTWPDVVYVDEVEDLVTWFGIMLRKITQSTTPKQTPPINVADLFWEY